jgi:hypothetical protein
VASQMRRLRELASRVAALERTAHPKPHEGEGAAG